MYLNGLCVRCWAFEALHFQVADMFNYFSMAMPIVITYVVLSVLIYAGFLLLILPGIYLSIAYVFSYMLLVDKGLGERARIPGYSVAGKTGTSQVSKPGGGYSTENYITSFNSILILTLQHL